MRYFILLARQLPGMDTKEIDNGTLDRKAITIINCVRSALFTSYGLRKNVNVIICSLEPSQGSIRIDGTRLRYMGPNERSIAIMLSKPIRRLLFEKVGEAWVPSPGITVFKKGLQSFAKELEGYLLLYQSTRGRDLREIRLTERIALVCMIDAQDEIDHSISILGKHVSNINPIRSDFEFERMILCVNNEADRRL